MSARGDKIFTERVHCHFPLSFIIISFRCAQPYVLLPHIFVRGTTHGHNDVRDTRHTHTHTRIVLSSSSSSSSPSSSSVCTIFFRHYYHSAPSSLSSTALLFTCYSCRMWAKERTSFGAPWLPHRRLHWILIENPFRRRHTKNLSHSVYR